MARTKKDIVIRRIYVPRFVGISEASLKLGVSKQAVSNFVSGRCLTALSASKAARIKVIDQH